MCRRANPTIIITSRSRETGLLVGLGDLNDPTSTFDGGVPEGSVSRTAFQQEDSQRVLVWEHSPVDTRSFGNCATREFAKGDRRHLPPALEAKIDSIFYLEESHVWLNAVSAAAHRGVSTTRSRARNPLPATRTFPLRPCPCSAKRCALDLAIRLARGHRLWAAGTPCPSESPKRMNL